MHEFKLYVFPFFHAIFGLIMILTAFKIINPIKDETKFKKFQLFLGIGGFLLFFMGVIELGNILK